MRRGHSWRHPWMSWVGRCAAESRRPWTDARCDRSLPGSGGSMPASILLPTSIHACPCSPSLVPREVFTSPLIECPGQGWRHLGKSMPKPARWVSRSPGIGMTARIAADYGNPYIRRGQWSAWGRSRPPARAPRRATDAGPRDEKRWSARRGRQVVRSGSVRE